MSIRHHQTVTDESGWQGLFPLGPAMRRECDAGRPAGVVSIGVYARRRRVDDRGLAICRGPCRMTDLQPEEE